MTTYTIIIGDDMLLATVPDGDDIKAALADAAAHYGFTVPEHYDVTPGCTLTDAEDFDPDFHDYVWKSGGSGWLIDETGADWRYAIKP